MGTVYKIMVVDDDPDFLETIKYDLEKEGYQVVLVLSGEEGLKKIPLENPHLILVDIKMPRMDGYTFVRHLKKDEDMSKIPVIVLTSYEPMKEIFEQEGVTDYFVKSVNTGSLFQTIRKRLEQHS